MSGEASSPNAEVVRAIVRIWPLEAIARGSRVVADCADAVVSGAMDVDVVRGIAGEIIAGGSRTWPVRPSADDIAEAAAEATWWLLAARLYVPQSRVRWACWQMVRDGLHRSDYRAVERAAERAAPSLAPQMRLEVLAEIVASQRRRSTSAARSRR